MFDRKLFKELSRREIRGSGSGRVARRAAVPGRLAEPVGCKVRTHAPENDGGSDLQSVESITRGLPLARSFGHFIVEFLESRGCGIPATFFVRAAMRRFYARETISPQRPSGASAVHSAS